MDEATKHQLYFKIDNRKRNFPPFAIEFMDSLDEELSLSTQLEYAKDLTLFFEYLIRKKWTDRLAIFQLAIEDMKEITEDDIRDFMEYLNEYEKEFLTVGGNRTVQTFSNKERGKERKRVCLDKFFQYLLEHHGLRKNPIEHIHIEVEKYKLKPFLTESQLDQLCSYASFTPYNRFWGERNRLILRLLAYTGIRISELVNLNLSNVLLDEKMLVITRKNGEEDYVPIPSSIQPTMERYIKQRLEIKKVKKEHKDALFLSQRYRRMDPKSIRKMIKKAATEAGIPFPVTPHTFRLTYGIKTYMETRDLEVTSLLLGNQSKDTARNILTQAIQRTSSE